MDHDKAPSVLHWAAQRQGNQVTIEHIHCPWNVWMLSSQVWHQQVWQRRTRLKLHLQIPAKWLSFLLMGPVCTLWQFRTASNNLVAQQLKCTRVECDSNQVELKKPHKTAWKVNLDSPICQHLSQTSPLHDSSGGSYHPQRDHTIYQEHGLASYLWCTPQHTCKQSVSHNLHAYLNQRFGERKLLYSHVQTTNWGRKKAYGKAHNCCYHALKTIYWVQVMDCTVESQKQQSQNSLPQVYAGCLQHIWVW
jgi:hypothetical protein